MSQAYSQRTSNRVRGTVRVQATRSEIQRTSNQVRGTARELAIKLGIHPEYNQEKQKISPNCKFPGVHRLRRKQDSRPLREPHDEGLHP